MRITVTDDLDRALLTVQIEIIDRVRRQEETELLGEPDTEAPPPLLLVATPGDARERIEAVLALGRPYGITGLLLEEPRPQTTSSDAVSDPSRGGAYGEGQVAHVPASREVAVIEPRVRPLQVTQAPAPAGLIRLLGHYAVEGAAGQRGGRSTDMWALLGLLAEHRTCLLSRSTAEAKLWPDQEGSAHRFPNLLKDTRVKLCDALGRPHNQGRHVIENLGATGYRINPSIYTCDAWQLRDFLAAAGRTTGGQQAAALNNAVELYTGRYLPDNPHSWAEDASRAVDREVVQALAQLAELETEPECALLHLERATQIGTTAQRLYRRRM
jgi:DNA-binding winged helix-turn-helix (wHTH) protein